MDSFPLLSAPLVVQDAIVYEIINNLDLYDCVQFSRTSEHSFWLIQRTKLRKVVKYAEVVYSNDKFSLYLDGRNYHFNSTASSMIHFRRLLSFIEVTTLRITTRFFKDRRFGFCSEFRNLWIGSVKKLRKLQILSSESYEEDDVFNLLKSARTLVELEVHNAITDPNLCLKMVNSMQSVRNLHMTGLIHDSFLEVLAAKSSPENPITKCYIFSSARFSPTACQRFIQNAHLAQNANIRIGAFEDHVGVNIVPL